jgi:hypothetical protein
MFNWLKRKKSTTEEHELENTQPPKIRKPTHAARDARMSIPVGEREYYDILEARKRAGNNSPSIGTSVMKGKGKEKATSPLAYSGSGEFSYPLRAKFESNSWPFCFAAHPSSSTGSSPAFSVTTSYTGSFGYDADMGDFWDTPAGVSRRQSMAQTSFSESSRDAVARAHAKKAGVGNAGAS